MMVNTSGSCSRIFSVRRFSAMRRAAVGAAPQTAPTTPARMGLPRIAAPMAPPTRKATTETTTNSPDRMLTPAASSSASSRSLKPRASANRLPKWVTRSGIQPEVPSAED